MNLRNLAKALTRRTRASDSTGDVASVPSRDQSVAPSYHSRVASEQRFFAEPSLATELPEIFQYWSNNFLRPRLVRAGFDGPLDMFRSSLSDAYERSARSERRFLSIGSGDCQTEIALARHLLQGGQRDFVFECLELNPALVASGNAHARDGDVSQHIAIVETDINSWSPSCEYDAVLANSSLHHIQNLEHVFDGIAQCLSSWGTFITSDTIGRNGHMRWPEALEIIEEYWGELPREYRFNHQLQRYEDAFENWDCSSDGFEGIRAQDILPLLIERFDFDYFAGFANIIDPFIDRSFGHNFNSARPWDRAFIDRVEARDVAEIRSGRIKPTHIVAAMCVDRPGQNIFVDGMTPHFCVRHPSRRPRPIVNADGSDGGSMDITTPESTADDASTGIEINVLPLEPRSADYVIAQIRVKDAAANLARDRSADGSVEIAIRSRGSLSVPVANGVVEAGLGCYPVGEINIAARIGARRISRRVQIAGRADESDRGVRPAMNFSDLWWNPKESGWGISVHQHSNGQLVALWLGFDDGGTPTWLSLNPGKWVSANAFEGPVFRHTGSSALKPYDASDLTTEVAGSGTLVFDSVSTGRLTLELRDMRIVKDIERMGF